MLMYFVGRKKEIVEIERALAQEQSILIRGKFGMGRTALVRHIAAMNRGRRRFWFADFAKPPEKMCRKLHAELFSERRNDALNYKTMRRQIVDAALAVAPKVVLVLDNIEVLTFARIELGHYFALSDAFVFIAVVDRSLDVDSVMSLRAVFHLSQQIYLTNLKPAEVEEFYRFYDAKFKWGWSEEQIVARSRLTRGYPLIMAKAVSENIIHLNHQKIKGEITHGKD